MLEEEHNYLKFVLNLSNEIDRIKKENVSMQINLRHLKGNDVTSLNYKDLMSLKNALENGLTGIRNRQNKLLDSMRKNACMYMCVCVYIYIDRIKKENASMQINLRHLKGKDVTSLNYKDLMSLKNALENGLTGIRSRQSKMLEEEHNYLKFVLRQLEIAKQQQQMVVENNVREIEKGYHLHYH